MNHERNVHVLLWANVDFVVADEGYEDCFCWNGYGDCPHPDVERKASPNRHVDSDHCHVDLQEDSLNREGYEMT